MASFLTNRRDYVRYLQGAINDIVLARLCIQSARQCGVGEDEERAIKEALSFLEVQLIESEKRARQLFEVLHVKRD